MRAKEQQKKKCDRDTSSEQKPSSLTSLSANSKAQAARTKRNEKKKYLISITWIFANVAFVHSQLINTSFTCQRARQFARLRCLHRLLPMHDAWNYSHTDSVDFYIFSSSFASFHQNVFRFWMRLCDRLRMYEIRSKIVCTNVFVWLGFVFRATDDRRRTVVSRGWLETSVVLAIHISVG